MEGGDRRYPLVLGALGVEHCHQHLAITVASGAVGAENFTEAWRWRLVENLPCGGEERF